MNYMPFSENTDLNKSQTPVPVSYFDPNYLSLQEYDKLLTFENEGYLISFSLDQSIATSLPRAPFGSYMAKELNHSDSFLSFEKEATASLKIQEIEQLSIVHPSPIYKPFVDVGILKKVGYQVLYEDINQHIPLTEDWENTIHKMQSRKLKSLQEDGFEFKKMPNTELEKAHQFLSVCREVQGLKINISWEKLRKLSLEMPHTYECFGVFRDGKMSAVCIAVRVTADVVYYYLPGTSPFFKARSPMVLLIAGMVSYYRRVGFKYWDLGISSVHGKPQETLRIFKERMGAEETMKPSLVKNV